MHMLLALFSGPTDPQIASQTVEGAKANAGGELFAGLVEGGDSMALPTQGMDIKQTILQIPAVPARKLPEAALQLPQNLKGMVELGHVTAADQPLIETAPLPLGEVPPLETRGLFPVHGDTVGLKMPTAAPLIEFAPAPNGAPLDPADAREQSVVEAKVSDPSEPKMPPLEGYALEQALIEPRQTQAFYPPQMSAPPLPFSAPLVPGAVIAGAETDAPMSMDTAEATTDAKVSSPELRAAPSAPQVADQNAQLAGPLVAKTIPYSGSSGEIAAKLLPEAFASLENPETSAALVKAIAPLPSPEQASAAQAAILYQSGVQRGGNVSAATAPLSLLNAPSVGLEAARSDVATPLPKSDMLQSSVAFAPAFDVAPPLPSTPKVETLSTAQAKDFVAPIQAPAAPSDLPAGMNEAPLGARNTTPLQASIEKILAPAPQTFALAPQSKEPAISQAGERREAASAGPVPLRSEVLPPAQTAKPLEQAGPSPRQSAAPVMAADMGSMTAAPFETFEPEMQAFGLGASSSEARVGSAALVPLALLTNPEVPQRVAQQIAEAARALPDRPVELNLNPEELGRVRMTMQASEGAMSVVMAVERPETLDLMRRHIETLAAEFRAMGYRDVSFSFSQQGQGGPGDESSRGGNSARAQGSLDEPAPLQNTPHKLALDGAGAMDIRL